MNDVMNSQAKLDVLYTLNDWTEIYTFENQQQKTNKR